MRYLIPAAAAAMAMTMATAAEAQIRLPAQLPSLQLGALQQNLGALDPLSAEPDTLRALSDVRRQTADHLIRSNRRLIETDPHGEPIVRGELMATSVDDAMPSQWATLGFAVERTETLPGVDLRIVVLKVPEHLSTRKALDELRAADPRGTYDYDHIYLQSGPAPVPAATPAVRGAAGAGGEAAAPGSAAAGNDTAGNDAAASGVAAGGTIRRIRVGLLDTGIDDTHPAFRGSDVHPWGCGGRRVPAAHGTAVASLLTARGAAELYAADVYCGEPTGGSVDAIVAALGWMSAQQVAVINVSLVGPANLLLERTVGALIARGHLIVAAVGNDGPAAPPLYPAAYPNVVGVTAVDGHRRVLIEAERGPQVMFAALGADLDAASLDHGYAPVRGTSFAAPTVAALLAPLIDVPDREHSLAAIDALSRRAIDLGPPGRDLTYGFGLVGSGRNDLSTSYHR